MTKQVFEEKFPSIKDNVVEGWIESGYDEEPSFWQEVIEKQIVEKYCLDKRRVKEAIEKIVLEEWQRDLLLEELDL